MISPNRHNQPDSARRSRAQTQNPFIMRETIRNGNLEIIGYRDTGSGSREVLRDKNGRILGRFETDTGVTRAADGKIIGRGSNQLFRLLK